MPNGSTLTYVLRVATCALCLTMADRLAAQPQKWVVAESPAVRIGAVEGDERYTLSLVSDVLPLTGGRIAISERTTGRIRVYDRTGRHITDWGRQGEGPGEYRIIRSLSPYRGDSVAVHDFALGRISILDQDGRFGRSINLRLRMPRVPEVIPSQSCCILAGALDDGTFIAATPEMIPTHRGGTRWGMQTFYRISEDGSRIDSIGSWRGNLYSYDASAPSHVRDFHYSPRAVFSTADQRLYVGNGSTYEIHIMEFAPSGPKQTASIRGSREPLPVTSAVRDSFEARLRHSYAENPQRYESPLENYLAGEFPRTLPVFNDLLVDSSGRLWVWIRSDPSDAADTGAIDVFSINGNWIATMELPEGIWPVAVTDDAIIARGSDPTYGVEYVTVHPIRRP